MTFTQQTIDELNYQLKAQLPASLQSKFQIEITNAAYDSNITFIALTCPQSADQYIDLQQQSSWAHDPIKQYPSQLAHLEINPHQIDFIFDQFQDFYTISIRDTHIHYNLQQASDILTAITAFVHVMQMFLKLDHNQQPTDSLVFDDQQTYLNFINELNGQLTPERQTQLAHTRKLIQKYQSVIDDVEIDDE